MTREGRPRVSRRNKAPNVNPHLEWPDGIPPGQKYVAIRFVCNRKGHGKIPCAVFGMDTWEGSERRVWAEQMPHSPALTPWEKDRPDGQGKAFMFCPKCGHQRQVSEARLAEALLALWEPGARRVVEYRL